MTTNHPVASPSSRTRRVIFRVAAGLVAFALLTATPNVLAPWADVNIADLADPEQARWDLALEGVLDLFLMVCVVVALFRPARSALLVQLVLIAAVVTAVVLAPFLDPAAWLIVVLLLLVPLTYPYPRQLFSLRSEQRPSTLLLAVAVIAAAVLAPVAVHAIRMQITPSAGTEGDLATLAGHAQQLLILAFAGLLVATLRPAWKVLAALVTAAYAYLGLVSILLPDQPNSWGTLGGTASLVGSAAFATAAVVASRGHNSVGAEVRSAKVEQRQ